MPSNLFQGLWWGREWDCRQGGDGGDCQQHVHLPGCCHGEYHSCKRNVSKLSSCQHPWRNKLSLATLTLILNCWCLGDCDWAGQRGVWEAWREWWRVAGRAGVCGRLHERREAGAAPQHRVRPGEHQPRGGGGGGELNTECKHGTTIRLHYSCLFLFYHSR